MWRVTGFPWYDRDGAAGLPPALSRFLDDGPPPVVFTLGSAVAADAGPLFEHSAAVTQRLGRRAVLILKDPRNRPPAFPAPQTSREAGLPPALRNRRRPSLPFPCQSSPALPPCGIAFASCKADRPDPLPPW
jgi:hypothetical protein